MNVVYFKNKQFNHRNRLIYILTLKLKIKHYLIEGIELSFLL